MLPAPTEPANGTYHQHVTWYYLLTYVGIVLLPNPPAGTTQADVGVFMMCMSGSREVETDSEEGTLSEFTLRRFS